MKRIIHKVLSLLLTVAMVFSMGITSVLAEEKTDTWDGSIALGYDGGTGTESDPYQIATGAQLAYLSKLCKDKSEEVKDKHWILTADIDLNNKDWTPIGSYHTIYATGSFDGDGHTVSRLYIKTDYDIKRDSSFGLFGMFEGEITDLTVSGSILIDNKPDGTSARLEASYVGGICGLMAADVTNCRNEVNITVNAVINSSDVGGISGYFENSVMEGCINTGSITYTASKINGDVKIGGLTGGNKLGTINACKNEGKISSGRGYVGGIVGQSYTGNESGQCIISNCINSGDITLETPGQIGGVVGSVSSINYNGEVAENSILNCLNTGTVTYTGSASTTKVGAIYGFTGKTIENNLAKVVIDNCYYTQDVKIGTGTTVVDEEVVQKSIEEIKTKGFVQQIANDNNYEGSSSFWIQKEDGSAGLIAEIANYSKVDEAEKRVPDASALEKYTDETVKQLKDALDAVVRGKVRSEQEIVNGYAAAIEAAMNALVYKDADYTKVNEAIAKIPADLTKYTDQTVQALRAARNAVVNGKNITEQETVNGYATAIENAIKALTLKSGATVIVDSDTGTKIEREDGSAFDSNVILSVFSKPQSEMDKFKDSIDKAAPGLVLGGLYDIKLLKDGVAIQPNGKTRVSIPLTESMKAMTDLKVVYIDEQGNVTIISSEVKDGKISFVTDHFSYYGVIGKVKVANPGNNSTGNGADSPQTGDDSNLSLVIIGLLFASVTFSTILVKRRKSGRHI